MLMVSKLSELVKESPAKTNNSLNDSEAYLPPDT